MPQCHIKHPRNRKEAGDSDKQTERGTMKTAERGTMKTGQCCHHTLHSQKLQRCEFGKDGGRERGQLICTE